MADINLSGTMSSQDVNVIPGGALDCVEGVTTTGNFCADQLRLNNDKSVDGETIFIRINCDNRMPLGNDQQDLVYQKPGVPLDRGLYSAFASWGDNDVSTSTASNVKCETTAGSPDMMDCNYAF